MSSNATDHLPAAPSELTLAWLGAKLGQEIKSHENTRTIRGTGSKLFYTITYADATTNQPTHVCIKGVFDPAMIAAQPWTIAPALSSTMLFPRGWWAGTSATQGIVIIDDLTTSGCTFAPEVASYPVSLVLNGVEQLAGLHARYWGQSEVDHAWIWNNYDPAIKFMCTAWDEVVRQPGRPRLGIWRRCGGLAGRGLSGGTLRL
ncbi:hypothetical protein B0T22DRAFT_509706 [Podospora appendiculata]|uniref:Uncharacterized protein n=1 Tax=Podospora appendiculata TaxID=314037 RepID=A0AAE0X7M7_9PEZI|nr:hypothetical protein B0T22DRAFT_509706 [Podospora appendiculata]